MQPRSLRIAALQGALVTTLVTAVTVVSAQHRPLAIDLPECVRLTTESRYRPFGYDHIVRLVSTCDEAASCSVSTDVSPTPIDVIVRARDSAEVVTFQGSPASEFAVNAKCRLLGTR